MKIEFPNREAINSVPVGMNFPAIVNGSQITCIVTEEALQDIVTENRTDSVEKQFNDNRSTFENIARDKIENGDLDIIITNSDIS